MSRPVAWPWQRVLAHRGGGTLAPENTIAGIKIGIAHGYRAVEFDAMVPSDDVAVLIHDPTLRRTARRDGRVVDLTAAELARLDAGSWHSPRFTGEPIPLLRDALQFCRSNGIWVNVEIKPAPGHEARTGRVVAREIAAAYGDLLRADGDQATEIVPAVPLLSSFSAAALESARDAVGGLPRGWLVDHVPSGWQETIERMGCVSLHADHRHLSRNEAARIKGAGFWLFCYTVNEPRRAEEILRWGVDAFCTDRIDLISPDIVAGAS